MGRHSPDYSHLFIEAKKLAYADRAKFYADPAFAKLPIAELISKDYAQAAAEADRHAARGHVGRAGRSADRPRGATRFICASSTRTATAARSSRATSPASARESCPGNVGFVMQNRGSQFSLDPKHLNTLEPHKRPFHTIIPAMVTKDGKPWLCFGVMGGDMQPQGHVQVLVNMIDFGLNVQAAGDEGRVRHDGSQTPTGHAMDPNGGFVARRIEHSAGHDRRTRTPRPPHQTRRRRRLRRLSGDLDRPGTRHDPGSDRAAEGRSGRWVLGRQLFPIGSVRYKGHSRRPI